MNLNIRNVQPEDLERVAEIEALCFPAAEAAEAEAIRERIAAFPESFLVAEEEGRMIGFINGCVTDRFTLCDAMFHSTAEHRPEGAVQTVFGLDVHPEHRRRGVAAQLMNRLIDASREAGRKAVILTCKDHLVHYYEGFGFANMGVSESTHGGAVWYDMTLTL